jgi:hypothetical protein
MKLTPPNNLNLPELNGFKARSFWLMLLTMIATVLNMQGIDVFKALREMGIGGNAQQVLATGDRLVGIWQQVLPLVTGVWAYLERRAPNYRLVWPWKWSAAVIVGLMPLLLSLSVSTVWAAAPQCAQTEHVLTLLSDKYGETPLEGGGQADGARHVALFANAAAGTWTVVAKSPNEMTCLLRSGQGWAGHDGTLPDGDPT